jgi:hypothetical protein
MTNLLSKYSKRKEGWKVRFLFLKDKSVVQNSVMVINNMGQEYLVEVDEGTPEEKVPHHLEHKVTQLIKDLESRDMQYVTRESLMYAIIAEALRAQTQYFVGYLKHEEKRRLNDFNKRVEQMTKNLSKPYERLVGKDMLEELKGDVAESLYTMYDIFRYTIDEGNTAEFMAHIKSFNVEEEKI